MICVVLFQDLKKFHYYYWFAFPCPSQPTVLMKQTSVITRVFNEKQLETIAQGHRTLDSTQKCFFAISKGSSPIVQPLAKVLNGAGAESDINRILSDYYFGFLDSSNEENPGWPLRIFLAALVEFSPDLSGADVDIVGLRHSPRGGVETSHIFCVNIPQVYIQSFFQINLSLCSILMHLSCVKSNISKT